MSSAPGDTPELSTVGYDDLVVDRRYGPFQETIDQELADRLRGVIGEGVPGALAPPAVFPVLFLRALRRAMGGIPPGSILGKQELEFHAPVRVGDTVSIETWVGDKYVRRERPYATIDFEIRNPDGAVALTGRKIIVWPALKEDA